MAASNGSDHEERLRKLEAARKEMEDTLIVMAHLESKSAERIKEHAQFIADHRAAMLEFDGKLNALIDIASRMQGGIESRS
jgi:tRNA isopentenyl-2-thiomethyl-A-37 hydroxylase MiaE